MRKFTHVTESDGPDTGRSKNSSGGQASYQDTTNFIVSPIGFNRSVNNA